MASRNGSSSETHEVGCDIVARACGQDHCHETTITHADGSKVSALGNTAQEAEQAASQKDSATRR